MALDLKKIHEDYVSSHIKREREKRSEKIRAKAGRPPIPEDKKRENNSITVYLNNDEYTGLKEYVGNQSTSDFVRNLIVSATGK